MNAVRPLSATARRRVSRVSLWLCLTVTWFAAQVMARVAPSAARKVLTEYAYIARSLLVARALTHLDLRKRTVCVRGAIRRLTIRAVAGPALRRALRRGTLHARANAICAALASPERWIQRIARRLRRRFTKLRRPPAPCRARLSAWMGAPTTPALIVNSS
jgi:hypothetical protein